MKRPAALLCALALLVTPLIAGCTSTLLHATCSISGNQAAVIVLNTTSQEYTLSGVSIGFKNPASMALPEANVPVSPVAIAAGNSYSFYVDMASQDASANTCRVDSLSATAAGTPAGGAHHHHHGCQLGLLGVCKGKKVSL